MSVATCPPPRLEGVMSLHGTASWRPSLTPSPVPGLSPPTSPVPGLPPPSAGHVQIMPVPRVEIGAGKDARSRGVAARIS